MARRDRRRRACPGSRLVVAVGEQDRVPLGDLGRRGEQLAGEVSQVPIAVPPLPPSRSIGVLRVLAGAAGSIGTSRAGCPRVGELARSDAGDHREPGAVDDLGRARPWRRARAPPSCAGPIEPEESTMMISPAAPAPAWPGGAGAGGGDRDDRVDLGAAVRAGTRSGRRSAVNSATWLLLVRRPGCGCDMLHVGRATAARATVMLSCPPGSLANSTSAQRERDRVGRSPAARTCSAIVRRPRRRSSTGRRSRPAASRAGRRSARRGAA